MVRAGVPGFVVRVPPSWFQFDVWRATRTADLARLVNARLEQHPALRPHRGALLRMLREVAEDAQRRGAMLCAVSADRIADAGTLLATLMVFHTAGDPQPGGSTVEAIAAGITAHQNGAGTGTWRRVSIVDLSAGRAVRVCGIEAIRQGEAELDVVSMHTLWPVSDGGGVIDVVLTSPQTRLAAALLDLFDAVSETFSWVPAAPQPLATPLDGNPASD